jgi:multidrug efflux pump subunit AcrB
MTHKSSTDLIQHTHNTARFFTEQRHVSWILLIGTVLWGVYGYFAMPQRKDPEVPVRVALVMCSWPGASSQNVEERLTQRLEAAIARNTRVEKIESVSRTGVAIVYVTLDEAVTDRAKELDDIKLKLDDVGNLPQGAGPIRFIKDFGDTAALTLTVASPRVDATTLELRARDMRRAIEEVRSTRRPGTRVAILHPLPPSMPPEVTQAPLAAFQRATQADGVLSDVQPLLRPGFVGLDGQSDLDDESLEAYTARFINESLKASEIHPDAWPPVVIRDPATTGARLAQVAGDRYTYRELDDFTDLIMRTLKTLPMVSKVDRSGVLPEEVTLEYSQERLASYGVSPGALDQTLGARNIVLPGGSVETPGKTLTIDPSGAFASEQEIGDVLVPAANGRALYLRDLADIVRTYSNPPAFLNFYSRPDADGTWQRTRAITLAIQMKAGAQIGTFGEAVDRALEELRARLPHDLILARTSDQPVQVEENVHLFMHSLEEAVILVVIVSLIGFWEWRSALLMALSIPITLAMTFGMMHLLGVDLQQVSIASLIIALGLLVDDPVVAGDAIKRELADGHPPSVAAWLGPTRLANAILYATVTNIVAYLPFLWLGGDSGTFVWSLPVVVTCSLVASRIVSMTFIPLLGYYLLKPGREKSLAERRQTGFAAFYHRVGAMAIRHRWAFLSASVLLLVVGGAAASQIRTQNFPQDDQYLSYVDVWLPEDAPLSATRAVAEQVEGEIQRVATALGRNPAGTADVLKSVTTFLGGGGPRFWYSVSPEPQQTNYAQMIIEVSDKRNTARLHEPLQRAVSANVAGARVDVHKLELGAAVPVPIGIRLSGEDIPTLRALAAEVRGVLTAIPSATRVHDNWGAETFAVKLATDADRANLAGVTNYDVAASSATGLNGFRLGVLRERDRQIPIVAKLRMGERAQLQDVQNLYVYASQGPRKVPLSSISSIHYETKLEKIQRRNQFRTITVSGFAEPGYLPSEVLAAARPRLDAIAAHLPPGFHLEIGGEREEQLKSFRSQGRMMAMSVALIFLALVMQFKHAAKPLVVFAAIPFGIAGAFVLLWATGMTFGFVAFLGISSLVGVIVSHIVVLFDFIEEAREHGEPLQEALLDAGVVRLRPVLITVAATVIALIPLARNGGPLWEAMCYAQIGGLTVATFVTLLIVPVLYAVFVLDLRLIRWQSAAPATEPSHRAGVLDTQALLQPSGM